MNINKFYDFFQPETVGSRLHIIGCGAIGSTVAENLVRFGITEITLYDIDIVSSHNIANQMYEHGDIGKPKVSALRDMLCRINPECESNVRIVGDGWHGQRLSGYVFLCVDKIDLRRKIATENRNNAFVKAMFDFRMRLVDAQHYAANWKDPRMVESFIKSMDFTSEEAMADTPVSACNLPLSIATTVRMISACGVSNFINFTKGNGLKKLIEINSENFKTNAF